MKGGDLFSMMVVLAVCVTGLVVTSSMHERDVEVARLHTQQKEVVVRCITKTIKDGHDIWHRTKCPEGIKL